MRRADRLFQIIQILRRSTRPVTAAALAQELEVSKRTVYRDVAKRSLTAGGLGSVGEKAASAIADFVLLDMFASYCIGREDAKGAMRTAERRLYMNSSQLSVHLPYRGAD